MTGSPKLRIGIVGCGRAGRLHLDRLLALAEVEVVGCADPDRGCAESLAERVGPTPTGNRSPVFGDHLELVGALHPDALCIFTSHFRHYPLAMDALQAGCHVFIEKPSSTNGQEAPDALGLAQGRQLKVGVGQQYRLCPSLHERRRLLRAGSVGKIHLVTALMARPWVDASEKSVNDWTFDSKLSRGGVLTDACGHLIDALLWTTGQTAEAVYALQSKRTSRLDLVMVAWLGLRDGTRVTLAVSGACAELVFELHDFGQRRRMRVTDIGLEISREAVPVPAPAEGRARNHRWKFRVRGCPWNPTLLPCRGGTRNSRAA
jgi:predicted dehydrogenase